MPRRPRQHAIHPASVGQPRLTHPSTRRFFLFGGLPSAVSLIQGRATLKYIMLTWVGVFVSLLGLLDCLGARPFDDGQAARVVSLLGTSKHPCHPQDSVHDGLPRRFLLSLALFCSVSRHPPVSTFVVALVRWTDLTDLSYQLSMLSFRWAHAHWPPPLN